MAGYTEVAMQTKEILPALTLDFLEKEYDNSKYLFEPLIQTFRIKEEERLKNQVSR